MKQSPRGLRRSVPLRHRRAYLSLVAFICDDAAIQPHLPQIIVSNDKILSKAVYEEAQTLMTTTIQLWRRNTAWLDTKAIIEVLKCLHRALSSHLPTKQIILCLDANRAHLHKKIWQTCTRLGFFLFVIPSKMTWCLQPLDAQVFGAFKQVLRRNAENLDMQGPTTTPIFMNLINALVDTIKDVFQNRSWTKSFIDLGLMGPPSHISNRVRDQLHYQGPPNSNVALPSLRQLQSLWPDRAIIPLDVCFQSVTRIEHPRHLPKNSLARFRHLCRRGPLTRSVAHFGLSSTGAASSGLSGHPSDRSWPVMTPLPANMIPPMSRILRLPSSARLPSASLTRLPRTPSPPSPRPRKSHKASTR